MMNSKDQKILFPSDRLLFLLTVLVSAAGIILRFSGIALNLEYDEIWTCQQYGNHSLHDIFTDLATPNNHCLNTLLIQWSTALFGFNSVAVRLPVLIFGCLTLLLGSYGVWRLSHSRSAQFFASALIALQPMLVHYSSTARGYSIQTFFVLAMTFLLLRSAEHPHDWKTAAALLGTALLSCLSVTAGLIFVCSFCGAFLLWMIPWRQGTKILREYIPFLTAGTLFWIFALCWYGSQYSKLKQGQQFGTAISGPADLCLFFWNTFAPVILPLLILFLAAVFCPKGRRTALFFLTSCLLVGMSAVFTKAGPPRTYMAVYPAFITGAALILPDILSRVKQIQKYQLPIVMILILPEMMNFSPRMKNIIPMQWSQMLPPLMTDSPANTLICYSGCDGLPIKVNCPEAVNDMAQRLQSGTLSSVLTVGLSSQIEACDFQGNIVSVPLPLAFEKAPGIFVYRLLPIEEQDPIQDHPLLMTLTSSDIPYLTDGFLNGWYCINIHLSTDLPVRALLLPKAAKSAAEYLIFSQRSNGRIRFYRFAENAGTEQDQ